MSCCCPHSIDAGRFFSRVARLQRWHYRRTGLEPSQRQLVEGLKHAGIEGATLLEIGSGVGYLHQHLLEAGAAHAVGIDLAERMITEARALARARGLSARTQYRVGDFVDQADTFEPADVTILDKVICCYPDAEALVQRSLARTRRVYAYTLPRDRWYTRLGVHLQALALRLIGSRFRPYVHDPNRVAAWATAAGFERCYENETLAWLTHVYRRSEQPSQKE
jgi:magnesium-protoporphyrin O-methyltransferase